MFLLESYSGTLPHPAGAGGVDVELMRENRATTHTHTHKPGFGMVLIPVGTDQTRPDKSKSVGDINISSIGVLLLAPIPSTSLWTTIASCDHRRQPGPAPAGNALLSGRPDHKHAAAATPCLPTRLAHRTVQYCS